MGTTSQYLMLLGAAVVGSGRGAITTPASLRLSRSNEYTLTFTKQGYEPATVHVEKHLQAGNLVLDLFAGLIGVAVDAGTGGWNSLSPDSAAVTLTRSSASFDGQASIMVQVAREPEGIQVESSAPGVEVTVEVNGGK